MIDAPPIGVAIFQKTRRSDCQIHSISCARELPAPPEAP
jgi:hypothetical protein